MVSQIQSTITTAAIPRPQSGVYTSTAHGTVVSISQTVPPAATR